MPKERLKDLLVKLKRDFQEKRCQNLQNSKLYWQRIKPKVKTKGEVEQAIATIEIIWQEHENEVEYPGIHELEDS